MAVFEKFAEKFLLRLDRGFDFGDLFVGEAGCRSLRRSVGDLLVEFPEICRCQISARRAVGIVGARRSGGSGNLRQRLRERRRLRRRSTVRVTELRRGDRTQEKAEPWLPGANFEASSAVAAQMLPRWRRCGRERRNCEPDEGDGELAVGAALPDRRCSRTQTAQWQRGVAGLPAGSCRRATRELRSSNSSSGARRAALIRRSKPISRCTRGSGLRRRSSSVCKKNLEEARQVLFAE